MATVTFNLPKPLNRRVEQLASARMLSKSAFIRLLLQDHAEHFAPSAQGAPTPKKKGGNRTA